MAGEHYLELRSFTTGARLGVVTGATASGGQARNGFRRLIVRRQVNAAGAIEVELPGDHPLLPLADKTLILDWRRDAARAIPWYLEHVALFRDPEYQSSHGARAWTLRAPGLPILLDWYQILWPAGVASRTVFSAVAAETIMKTLTTRNAVAATATAAAGRDRNAPDYGISSAADAAGGTTISWTANRTNTLLEELQAIALIGGGDFELAYVSATSFEFRFHAGQLGTNKSASIVFAENLGNMDNVRLRQLRSQERTVALIAGQGEGADRDTVIRTGTNFASGNDIEDFIDARDIEKGATAQLQARGDQKLDAAKARDEFSFDVVQTQGTYYGPSGAGSYTLGDLVSARRPDGVTVTQQVYGVTIDWDAAGKETIGVEVITK